MHQSPEQPLPQRVLLREIPSSFSKELIVAADPTVFDDLKKPDLFVRQIVGVVRADKELLAKTKEDHHRLFVGPNPNWPDLVVRLTRATWLAGAIGRQLQLDDLELWAMQNARKIALFARSSDGGDHAAQSNDLAFVATKYPDRKLYTMSRDELGLPPGPVLSRTIGRATKPSIRNTVSAAKAFDQTHESILHAEEHLRAVGQKLRNSTFIGFLAAAASCLTETGWFHTTAFLGSIVAGLCTFGIGMEYHRIWRRLESLKQESR